MINPRQSTPGSGFISTILQRAERALGRRKLVAWCLRMTCLGAFSQAIAAGQPAGQRQRSESFAYRVGSQKNLAVESAGGRQIMTAKSSFNLTLVPESGPFWNMEAVALLGLMIKNTGATEMTLYLSLENANATPWSSSSLGATVIRPGETLPLVVALGRRDIKIGNPHVDSMSGKPSGLRRHWQTIDSAKVVRLTVHCPDEGAHSFELAEMFALQKLNESAMSRIPFVDKFGQYMHGEWPGKIRADRELVAAVAAEKQLEAELGARTEYSQYGGWKKGPRLEATGAFRLQKHDGRWWFVDPDGYLFWSSGVSGVGIDWAGQSPLRGDLSVFAELPAKEDPKFGQFFTLRDFEGHDYTMMRNVLCYDFSRANLFRKYGAGWQQEFVEQTIRRMKYCRLNTIGAWSDDNVVMQRKVPYTAMIHYEYPSAALKIPDPFNPGMRAGLRKALREYPVDFRNDAWCLGAFVDNELRWQNSAPGMVGAILGWPEEGTAAKGAFRDWLQKKYQTTEAFNRAWQTAFATWDDLLKASSPALFKQAKSEDCSAMATLFADAYFKVVDEELAVYSSRALFLGCRVNTAPEEVMRKLAEYADAISINDYSYRPNIGLAKAADKPVLLTEFHFGNLTGNNLGGGLRSAADAVQMGRLFRSFMEAAAINPRIVGAHWFQWNDQNVTGRHDGENYNVGFIDVADQVNLELVRAAEASGRTLYQKRLGLKSPTP